MKKRKYVFLDVDGTLIDYKTRLPKSAKLAIEKAQTNGHKMIICTGCSKCEIEARHMNILLDGMIGGNGCYIEYENQTILHRPLTLEQCIHFVNWCKDRDLAFRLECNEGMYISEGYEEKSLMARYQYIYGSDENYRNKPKPQLPKYMISGGNMHRDDVNKTAFVLRTYDDYLAAKEEFKDLIIDTWGGKGELRLYGATRTKGIDKKSSILYLLDKLGIDKQDTIAFGDGIVDIPMFKACGYSVAMGNACETVKEAADFVSNSVEKDGLYYAFKYLNLI